MLLLVIWVIKSYQTLRMGVQILILNNAILFIFIVKENSFLIQLFLQFMSSILNYFILYWTTRTQKIMTIMVEIGANVGLKLSSNNKYKLTNKITNALSSRH